jgi:hypothetical protein
MSIRPEAGFATRGKVKMGGLGKVGKQDIGKSGYQNIRKWRGRG